MPDTSRTLSAIKLLFADNSTGQVSQQDLRDYVESAVHPVAQGGFDWDAENNYLDVRDTDATAISLYRWNGGAFTAATTMTTVDYYVPANLHVVDSQNYDPGGWINASTVSSPSYWTGTIPANASIQPGRGVYLWSVSATLKNDPVADTNYFAYLDASNVSGGSTLKAASPVGLFENQYPNDLQTYPSNCSGSGFWVLDDDTSSVVPYLYAGATNGGGLTRYSLQMVRFAQ